jgi:NACalpha-BTF3-like transcription factor
MLTKAAESMGQPGVTPEMAQKMTETMKNMDPEQMKKMMEMSQKLAGKGIGPGSKPEDMSAAMETLLDDPDMITTSLEMMKNMDPQMMEQLSQQTGMSAESLKGVTDKIAAHPKAVKTVVQVAKVGYKGYNLLRRLISFLKTRNGKVALAATVVGLAMWYQSGSGATPATQEESTSDRDYSELR